MSAARTTSTNVTGTRLRVGDALSTFNDGVISTANAIARRKGVREGMKASEAARLMLG